MKPVKYLVFPYGRFDERMEGLRETLQDGAGIQEENVLIRLLFSYHLNQGELSFSDKRAIANEMVHDAIVTGRVGVADWDVLLDEIMAFIDYLYEYLKLILRIKPINEEWCFAGFHEGDLVLKRGC